MMASPFSSAELSEIRGLFPHTQNGAIYLNHAAISPLPHPVKAAMDRSISERHTWAVENFDEVQRIINQTRDLLGAYINSDPAQITFFGNTSDAISAVANGLGWQTGDEIILNNMEFPANIHPFRRLESKGVKLRIIPHQNHAITADDIRAHISPQTRLVSVSAVQFLSGYRADLESIGALCREMNLLFVVDGIQALGAAPIDVKSCHIDALASGAHKWLMAPMGIGFLYLSENLQEKLTPVKTGWLSVEEPWSFSDHNQPWLPVSPHLETGTLNFIGISGLGASLQLIKSIGTDLIERHVLYLTDFIMERLKEKNISGDCITQQNQKYRLGIVSFHAGRNADTDETINKLKKKSYTISARENYFRLSPHFYNTEHEIDTVLDQLFTIA
jgi:cysteine desulfurase / selenocysteine lyase